MSWPIPELPEKRPLPRPDYRKWGVIFFTMLTVGSMLSLFIGRVTSYEQVTLYGVLPAFFLWLCFLGVTWHRYEKSVNQTLLWNNESEQTKSHWQRWCMQQWLIIGNVVLTPEQQGIKALLGNYADIPAYPQKARSLFATYPDLLHRLQYIDDQIEEQCPGYRSFLYSVKILLADSRKQKQVSQSVYEQWDLYPEYIMSLEDMQSDATQNNMILILCLQDWQDGGNGRHSEFITGQLLASPAVVSEKNLKVLAGLGRVLSSNDLIKDIKVFSEYTRLDYTKLHHVWLTGTDGEDRMKIIRHADEQQWSLPPKQPCHSLDHTFGPPGPLSFPVSIALMVDAAMYTDEIQLLISRQKENEYALCLISRELLL